MLNIVTYLTHFQGIDSVSLFRLSHTTVPIMHIITPIWNYTCMFCYRVIRTSVGVLNDNLEQVAITSTAFSKVVDITETFRFVFSSQSIYAQLLCIMYLRQIFRLPDKSQCKNRQHQVSWF
jgi:hypothetical protein